MKKWMYLLILLSVLSLVLADNILVTHDQTFPNSQSGENTIRGDYFGLNASMGRVTLENVSVHTSTTCTNVFVFNLTGGAGSGFSVGNASITSGIAWMNLTLLGGHRYAIGCGVDGNGGSYTMYGNFGGANWPNFRQQGNWTSGFYRLNSGLETINEVTSSNYNTVSLGLRNGTIPVPGAPIISAINCTSCNIPFGDTAEPFTTSDTTPTFTFSTDINANCHIGASNVNYSSMGSSRNCTSGDGTLSHTCTLTTQDEIAVSSTTIYTSCSDTTGIETVSNSSAKLIMDIANLTTTSTDAVDGGIQTSSIWPGATVYRDQQIYLRNLANTQVTGMVDRVVVYGSQRWLLNVGNDNEVVLGLFNITPAVYSLELMNQSSSQIQSKISAFINATKR